MPFFPRTEKEIISEALQKMGQKTNITQLAPGGKARFFLATAAKEQASQQGLFDDNLLQPYIKYSEGKFLDFFGDMLNLPRVPAAHATTSGNNFMFYVPSGTFGDINNASPFTIPSGTTVFTSSLEGEIFTPGIEEQPVVTYMTTESVTCSPDSSFAYVSIRAQAEGEESSVPSNVLKNHSFASYTLSDTVSLRCTNRFAIDNGTNRESDSAYRYRLANIFRARTMAVLTSVRLAALAVPGVSNVIAVNCEQGPGTFALYIQSVTPTVSDDLVQQVTQAVSDISAYGVRAFISGPHPVGAEMVAAVSWSPRAKKEEISEGYNTMRSAVEVYLNGLNIGDGIELSLLIDIMLEASPLALRVGQNNPNKFEEVYLYKQSPIGDGVIRSLLVGDMIEVLYNERVILETSGKYRGIQFITF